VALVDLSEERDEEADRFVRTGPTEAHFDIGVRFPRSDIPVLVGAYG
jgi:hypothetical protein